METNRREFLKGTAWMGLAAAAAGCHLNRLGFGEGGSMQNFALKPMETIRVGFIGIGGRGTEAVRRVSLIPGCQVTALCDLKQERVDLNLAALKEKNYPIVPKTFVGPEAWKEVCESDCCDVIYCATPWALHQPIGLRGLINGKIALIEVTAALTVDQCWELVEASEKYRMPCMQLENCVYGEIELLELNLARMGMFGEITHVEGGYIHDLRECVPSIGAGNSEYVWRYGENQVHKGDRYPTHGLVPLCQTLGINRGDRLDYLVALGNGPHNKNYERMRREYLKDEDPRKYDPPAEMSDMNTTLIKTVNGVSIMVQHDVSSPRPYSRLVFISGTKGAMGSYPYRCCFEKSCKDYSCHEWMDEAAAAAIRETHMHPLWRTVHGMAEKVGGHGGMDFIMDLRWAWCLQNGIPLDMDVYDLAATSCLCELTELSSRNKSRAYDIPDFTRGNWRTVRPWGVVNVDLKKMGFDV